VSDLLKEWTEKSQINARLLAQETLILDASETILDAMKKSDVSKADLASALGKTKPFVTQLLNGSRNMTLRTLADIAFALGMKATVQVKAPFPDGIWQEEGQFTCVRVHKRFLAPTEVSEQHANEWKSVALDQMEAA
jgi:transcriptional regulator with XRE-family HTH domain